MLSPFISTRVSLVSWSLVHTPNLILPAELLKDETSLVDLVAPTLPILKALISRAFAPRHGTLAVLPKVANGMLSACLQNIDDVR